MAWIKLSDDYNDHPKFDCLSDGAFRLWHQAIGFCRKFQTDGLVPLATVRKFQSYSPKRVTELVTPWQPGASPLWVKVEGFGFRLHDYLIWNLSKEDENQQRAESKQRMALGRDVGVRNALHMRDGVKCRYCGIVVSWTDRRGPRGATYDHVDPNGGSLIENLVIACRGCNSRKGCRTPDQASMTLLPPPSNVELRSDLNRTQVLPDKSLNISGMDLDPDLQESTAIEKPFFRGERRLEPFPPDDIADRAAQLLEKYAELFQKYRRGAKYHRRDAIDFPKACELVRTWTDDVRLEKLVVMVLTTDDPWVSRTDRGFGIFVVKASWADDLLKQWELENGVTV
jgi:5-methylcytosine-specific restriction endonuclease McrA